MLTIDQRTAAHFAEAKQQRLQEDRDREARETIRMVLFSWDAATPEQRERALAEADKGAGYTGPCPRCGYYEPAGCGDIRCPRR